MYFFGFGVTVICPDLKFLYKARKFLTKITFTNLLENRIKNMVNMHTCENQRR